MSEAEKKKLWDEYGKTRSPEVKEKIIIEYAPLVKVVAGRLSMYLDIMWNMMIWLVTVYLV